MKKNMTFEADPDIVLAREREGGLTEARETWLEPSPATDQENDGEDSFVHEINFQIAHLREKSSEDAVCQTVRVYRFDVIGSFSDLLSLFKHQEANVRIYAADLAGRCGHLASARGQARLRQELGDLLVDNSPNDYVYGRSELEDSELLTVAAMAQRALRCLDCAASVQEAPQLSFGICLPVRERQWCDQ